MGCLRENPVFPGSFGGPLSEELARSTVARPLVAARTHNVMRAHTDNRAPRDRSSRTEDVRISTIGSVWNPCGIAMQSLWKPYRTPMGFVWNLYAIRLSISWLSPESPMVISWDEYGKTMQRLCEAYRTEEGGPSRCGSQKRRKT